VLRHHPITAIAPDNRHLERGCKCP
jgi:hypothetical protein